MLSRNWVRYLFGLRAGVLLFVCVATAPAEDGSQAWLRYAPPSPGAVAAYHRTVPAVVASFGASDVIDSARSELLRGIRGMTDRTLRIESGLPKESAILLGTVDALPIKLTAHLRPEAYWLKTVRSGRAQYTVITAADDRGVLYGAFAYLRKLAQGEPAGDLDEQSAPSTSVRWVNQWDNLDGSIERGYGGRSLFWEGGHARADLSRVSAYGRLLASLGINGCSINNVNADLRILHTGFLPEVARIAQALRPWGVRTVIAVDFGSPKSMGGLDTFDPVDPRVAAWWKTKIDEVYQAIPDLAGIVMKADSEGRVGPSAYGRTHADAANVVARALAPHHGLLFYRGFVYDHHMDWNNPKNDRARAAYDNFHALDGQFDDNVVLQIKHGPIDFQVREPVSPLFGALRKTKQAIELQITQEYFGQARHTVFIEPMWADALNFDLRVDGKPSPVKTLINGFVGVANVGLDDNWLGNHLSQANLYGFGRLAWNPDLPSRKIVDEWTRLTFGSDPKVLAAIANIQLTSWRTYENYTGPFGLQTLTDITGNHYGVRVEASERNGWGQWHRADHKGVGMDRTVASGTGYIGQYPPEVAKSFESRAACPDDLLLFLHHVPYNYRLHSGNTLIQAIYDTHYAGMAAAEDYVREWKSLAGLIDEQRFHAVQAQLEYQAGQAEEWRDAVVNWFLKESGIAEARGRAGHHPDRYEAESLQLAGYQITDVNPWEAASGGKAVSCPAANCAATLRYSGKPGWFDVRVRYFDQNTGAAHFRAFLGDQLIDEWTADRRLPTTKLDSTSSTLRVITGIALRPGDTIRIEGTPDGKESAALDYVELRPASN